MRKLKFMDLGKGSILFMGILALTVSLLSGCSIKNQILKKAGLPYHTQGEAVPITEIESISFTESTMEIPDISVSGIIRTQNGASVLLEVDHQTREVEYPVNEEILDKAKDILEKYDMGKWNGYSGHNPMVLDGSSFSLLVRFTDGSSLSAHGNNNFPDHYSRAKSEFDGLTSDVVESWQKEYGTEPETVVWPPEEP